MTLTELNNYMEKQKALKDALELLGTLRLKAYPGSAGLDGMPHGTGVSDRVGALAISIIDLESRLPELQKAIEEEEAPVIEFINSIRDSQTRTIFRMRFQGASSWKEVADFMGGYHTEKSVQMKCYRYLGIDRSGFLE